MTCVVKVVNEEVHRQRRDRKKERDNEHGMLDDWLEFSPTVLPFR